MLKLNLYPKPVSTKPRSDVGFNFRAHAAEGGRHLIVTFCDQQMPS